MLRSSLTMFSARRWIRRFSRWRGAVLVLLGVLVGAIGGLVVTVVGTLTQWLHQTLFLLPPDGRLSAQLLLVDPRLALIPAAGGAVMGLTVLLFRRFRKRAPVDPIEANAIHGGRMSIRESLIVTLQTVISSSCGASVGLEAGYTQMASALGSHLAGRLQLRRNEVRMLVGCGAAGAISAAFDAPLTGAFYAFELIIGVYSIGLLAPVIAAAIAGSLLATQLGAVQTAIDIGPVSQLSGTEIVPFMILGVIGGGFAIALMRTVNVVELGFSRLHCPQAIRPILGGLIVGGLGLITPQVLSSGHGALELQFTHNYDMLALAGLFVLKGLASSISLGSGFRGGLFFAALFLGALLGRLFSLLVSATGLGMGVDPGLAALVGMAALAVGVVGGPLTLTFLVLETTGDLAVTAAVLAAAAISGLLVRETFGFSFSTWRLHLRGENIRAPYDVGRVRNLTVGKLMRTEVRTVPTAMTIAEFCRQFPLGSTERVIALDSDDRYAGIVLVADAHHTAVGDKSEGREDVRSILHYQDRFLLSGLNAADAAVVFEKASSEELAVVDNITSRKVLGLLTEAYLLRRYSAELDQGWKDLTG